VILPQEIQLIEILVIFFLRFFQLPHHLWDGGYTCDFCRALATLQFKKKNRITMQRKQKNRSCSRGFKKQTNQKKRNWRDFFEQSEVKSKPIITACSHAFSRAWCVLHVFHSNSDWFPGCLVCCDWP